MFFKTSVLKEYQINEYITLKLIKNNDSYKTQIFLNGELFDQCKFLFLNIPKDKIDLINEINSIDEAADILDNKMEDYERSSIRIRDNFEQIPISPEQEFWAHCSNLQAWWESFYDTSLLHSNLSFPLLKKLTDVGDPIAKKVFKDEIGKRLANGYKSTVMFLVNAEYINYLNDEELGIILENFDFSQYIGKAGEFLKEEFTTLYRLAEKSSIAKSGFKKELVRVLTDGSLKKINEYWDVFDVFEEFFTREEQFHELLNEQEANIMIELEQFPYFPNSGPYLFLIINNIDDLSCNHYQIAIKDKKVVGLVLPECKINNFPNIIFNFIHLEVLYLGIHQENRDRLKKKLNQFKKLKILKYI